MQKIKCMIPVTKADIVDAVVEIPNQSEVIADLIRKNPRLALLLPITAEIIWDNLTNKEER